MPEFTELSPAELEWLVDVLQNYTQITGLDQAKTYISILTKLTGPIGVIIPAPPPLPPPPPALGEPRRRSGGGADPIH